MGLGASIKAKQGLRWRCRRRGTLIRALLVFVVAVTVFYQNCSWNLDGDSSPIQSGRKKKSDRPD